MDKRKIIYYSDELNDEFSTAKITPKRIDGKYVYCHSSLIKRFTHFFWYRIIFTPIAFFHSKLIHHHKTVGKEKLKGYEKTGYFMYGNHTQDIGDAFIPNMINFPKTNHFIVHPNNVSMPLLGKITPSLGAIPLPDDMDAYRNFISAVERRIKEGKCVVIYPEAHIWPYYTKIRNFPDTSFTYPIKYSCPVFCFTNTYQKRRFSKKPKIISYIDGPFFANEELPMRSRKKELRDRVYECMTERAKGSDTEQITYIKREEK
ncbi:MAG: 1-acyl-sn-glycerol-3-phosphate acyltransferase [Clostridia bacterium]|nr:1-acyl-sn-glycerol-3-phosphate acyltransferase [Clostridia bacterium]